MYALVLTGRMLPGCSADAVWGEVAAQFNLGIDVLQARVLSRAPVTIRELADLDQAQRMQSMLMHCGAEADLVPTDGVRWQLKSGDGQKGPVPLEFLRIAYARRMFADSVLVRRSTDIEWLSLERVARPSQDPIAADEFVVATRSGALPPSLPEVRLADANVERASPASRLPPPLPSLRTPVPVPKVDERISKREWSTESPSEQRSANTLPVRAGSSAGRVVVAAALLLLGAGGWYLLSTVNEALSISCDSEEVVDVAKSVIYRSLGPKMDALSGGFGLPMSEEAVKKFVSLELVGIGTRKREGDLLQCLGILKASQPPSADGDLSGVWRGVLIADLNDKPIRYEVIKAADGQHFTVTFDPQE